MRWNDNENKVHGGASGNALPNRTNHTDNRDWPTDKELGYDIPIQEMMPMKPKPNLRSCLTTGGLSGSASCSP